MVVSQMKKERTGGFNLCHCEKGRFRIPYHYNKDGLEGRRGAVRHREQN